MSYDVIVNYAMALLVLTGVIALGVSLFTEFFIKAIFTKLSTKALNITISVISILATVIIAAAYFEFKGISMVWYGWIAVVVAGFLVACIAMNGYDKIFKYVYDGLKKIFGK